MAKKKKSTTQAATTLSAHDARIKFDQDLRRLHDIKYLAGIDESGTGSVAGPIVTACVILPENANIDGINDSKKVNNILNKGNAIKNILDTALAVSVGLASAKLADRVGIVQADRIAMLEAVRNLAIKPDFLLIDGGREHTLGTGYPEITRAHADGISQTVAAASMLATYMQHQIMKNLDRYYPGYDFGENFGTLTATNKNYLLLHGVTDIHRRSYEPVRQALKFHPEVIKPTKTIKIGSD